jgi:hypothetical protein
MSDNVYRQVRTYLTGNADDTRVDHFLNAIDDFVRANPGASLRELLDNKHFGYFTNTFFRSASNQVDDNMLNNEFIYFINDMAQHVRDVAHVDNWNSLPSSIHKNIVRIIYRGTAELTGNTFKGGRPQVNPSDRQVYDIYVEYIKMAKAEKTSNTSFNLNMDKIISELASDRAQGQTSVTVDTLSWFNKITSETPVPTDLIYRKNSDQKLYRRNEDGVEVPVPPSKWAYNSTTQHCNSSFLKISNEHDCGMYFMNLLTGKNIQEAATFINNSGDFYGSLVNLEKTIHPDVAIQTLDGLGVGKVNGTVNSQSVVQYIQYEDWIDDIKKNKSVSNTIALENQKVRDYVSAVINYVNTNPSILNKNYRKERPDEIVPGTIRSRFDGVGEGEPHIRYVPNSNSIKFTDVSRIGSAINLRRASTAVSWGMQNVPPVLGVRPQFTSVYRGGDDNLVSKIMNDEYRVETKRNRTSHLLRQIFQGLEYDLSSRQKSLDSTNKEQIEKLFVSLENAENHLFKVLDIIDKYASGTAIDRDSNTSIDLPNIEKLIEKRNKLFKKIVIRENQLIPIQLTISSSMDDSSEQQ